MVARLVCDSSCCSEPHRGFGRAAGQGMGAVLTSPSARGIFISSKLIQYSGVFTPLSYKYSRRVLARCLTNRRRRVDLSG